MATLACLRELKGSNTESVVEEFAELLKRYGFTTVFGDRYGQAWVKDAFARHGIELRYSPLTRSELYLELLPGLRSRKSRSCSICRSCVRSSCSWSGGQAAPGKT